MIKIITPRQRKEEVHYEREFEWRDMPGAGFGFPCNKQGVVDIANMQPAGVENYRKCLKGEHNVIDKGIRSWTNKWTEPAVAECECGHHITLDSFTNTCSKCGADYNFGGQRLAPREQWGEETGETASDILMAGHSVS